MSSRESSCPQLRATSVARLDAMDLIGASELLIS